MAILEVCVDSADSLWRALEGGVDRIELCSALEIGGLSPSSGLSGQAMKMANEKMVPIYGMIRPRAGDFVYSELEIQTMELEIDSFRESKLAGIVFGGNKASGELDEKILARLAKRGQGMGMTLHRCVDLVPKLEDAIECAIKLGFERILTSGRAIKAIDGMNDLGKMTKLAGNRISIMPGSGINSENVPQILNKITGIKEIHSSCTFQGQIDSEMPFFAEEMKIKLEKFGFCGKLEKGKINLEEVRRMKNILKF